MRDELPKGYWQLSTLDFALTFCPTRSIIPSQLGQEHRVAPGDLNRSLRPKTAKARQMFAKRWAMPDSGMVFSFHAPQVFRHPILGS